MPELPEAERARALIEEAALGRPIAAVDDADTYVCRPHAAGEIAAALEGRVLTAALRQGKSLWVETDDGAGPDLGLHLGMAGRIVVRAGGQERSAGDPKPTSAGRGWDRFTLWFADGGALILRDKRRLGRVLLEPDLRHLGPDAGEVGRAAFRARVGRGAAPLKARIMDQAVIAGVGNLLADETLWQAGLSPVRAAGSLSEDELDTLRRALRAAIRRAHRLGGVHTGVVIAERRHDGACPRCGGPLTRAKVGGRTTWWCPACQE
jgi:formamidopyrimidine-DNA glycosylase